MPAVKQETAGIRKREAQGKKGVSPPLFTTPALYSIHRERTKLPAVVCEKGGLCILRIHDIFSACVVWFTFVSRTQEHRAVGSSGIGLTDSRGSFPLWDCLSLISWVYCTTNLLVCQYLFEKSLRRWWELNPRFPMANVSKWATLLYLSHLCGSRTVLPHRLLYPYCITL